ncbi:hypothetical protein AABB24_014501, partial [Solanum stoloniferum]
SKSTREQPKLRRSILKFDPFSSQIGSIFQVKIVSPLLVESDGFLKLCKLGICDVKPTRIGHCSALGTAMGGSKKGLYTVLSAVQYLQIFRVTISNKHPCVIAIELEF